MTKENRGRKSKINKDIVKVYLACRSQFMSVEDAAMVAEVSKQTIYNWQNRGKKAKEEIEKSLLIDENYREEDHDDYDFYKFYLADNGSKQKQKFKLRKNLWHLAQDRMMTDKDGVYKIDKAGSAAANIALLNTFDDDFKEENDNSQGMHQTVIYNNIDKDIKDDILARMGQAQAKQVDVLINDKEIEDEGENEQ